MYMYCLFNNVYIFRLCWWINICEVIMVYDVAICIHQKATAIKNAIDLIKFAKPALIIN